MRLLIKQRVFSWSDTYDVYDGQGRRRYFVKANILSLAHKLHIYDTMGRELGEIRQKIITMLPAFEIDVDGVYMGRVQKRFTLFRPKYEIELMGWRAEGDFLGWNYDIYEACGIIARVHKELFHWGDTYVIDIDDDENDLLILMLVIAIDAANCSNNN